MASLRRSLLVFRVAGMAGVLRAEETSSKGSEEDRGRDRGRKRRKRIYSIPGLRFP